jgi:hypothetical protein
MFSMSFKHQAYDIKSKGCKYIAKTWKISPIGTLGNAPAIKLHTNAVLWIWIRTGLDKLDMHQGWQKLPTKIEK